MARKTFKRIDESENPFDTDLLKPWVELLPDPKKFQEYYDYIIKSDVMRLDGPQFGYIETNIKVAREIPEDHIVIDAGCGIGWQQVLYQKHKKYIGINYFYGGHNIKAEGKIDLWPLFPTAYLYQGEFHSVIDKIMEEHNLKTQDDNVTILSCVSFYQGEFDDNPSAKLSRNKFEEFKNQIVVVR